MPVTPGRDIVFSTKTKAAEASFQELRRAAADLLTRAGMIVSEPQDERPE
jgi:RNase P protein component